MGISDDDDRDWLTICQSGELVSFQETSPSWILPESFRNSSKRKLEKEHSFFFLNIRENFGSS